MEYGLKPLSWVTISATLLLSLYAPWWIHAAEVPNMANFDGWRDGIIFEYSDMEEVKRQMLHLAQVVSRFEHSWPIQNPGYDFLINGIQVDDHGSHYRHLYSSNSAIGSCEASNDSLWGSLYDYNAAGTGLEAIVSFPHRLVNSQGLLMWHPSTIAEEQTLHIYYSLIPNKNPDPAYLSNNTKRCEFRIERSGYCPGTLSLQDKSGNLARSPPAPVANIHYNTQSRVLEFEVLAQYIFKEATYLIDFVDFDVKTDSIRYKAPSSCSNRYDAADQQRLTFRELWYSAPHANFADALSGQYSAYNSPPCWNLTNASCSQIRYFASFSLDQILRCTDHNGNPAITYDYTPDGLLNYRGNLFVNVLAPIDVNTESWGYGKFRHIYPFHFGFRRRIINIITSPTSSGIRIIVRTTALFPNGTMYLAVETESPSPGIDTMFFVPDLPLIIPAQRCSVSTDSTVNSSSVICIQQWIFAKDNWTSLDNLNYTLIITDLTGFNLTFFVQLVTTLQPTDASTGLDLGTIDVRLFATENDLRSGFRVVDDKDPRQAFNPGETIYTRIDYTIPEEERDRYVGRILNAWVCFSDIPGYVIEWIEGEKFGCMDVMINSNQRIQLLENHSPANTTWRVKLMDVVSYLNPNGPASSFSFIPDSPDVGDRSYTLHIQAILVNLDEVSNSTTTTMSTITAISSTTAPTSFTPTLSVTSSASLPTTQPITTLPATTSGSPILVSTFVYNRCGGKILSDAFCPSNPSPPTYHLCIRCETGLTPINIGSVTFTQIIPYVSLGVDGIQITAVFELDPQSGYDGLIAGLDVFIAIAADRIIPHPSAFPLRTCYNGGTSTAVLVFFYPNLQIGGQVHLLLHGDSTEGDSFWAGRSWDSVNGVAVNEQGVGLVGNSLPAISFQACSGLSTPKRAVHHPRNFLSYANASGPNFGLAYFPQTHTLRSSVGVNGVDIQQTASFSIHNPVVSSTSDLLPLTITGFGLFGAALVACLVMTFFLMRRRRKANDAEGHLTQSPPNPQNPQSTLQIPASSIEEIPEH